MRFGTIFLALTSLIAGCGGDQEEFSVESKPMCLVEVATRLTACEGAAPCEQGVARFAGYCYNQAPGDQLDICRGGQYFFEQPLKQMSANHPVLANLDKRQREILIRSGEIYCNYNYN